MLRADAAVDDAGRRSRIRHLLSPEPGLYLVAVHGFETDGPDADCTLFSRVVGEAGYGNLIVSGPESAEPPGGAVT